MIYKYGGDRSALSGFSKDSTSDDRVLLIAQRLQKDSKVLRVLQVFKTYWPDTFGGVERVMYEICQNGPAHNISCDVLTLSDQPTNGELIAFDDHHYASYRLNFYAAATGFSVPYFLNFKRFVERYDVIHYQFPWPFMDLVHLTAGIKKPYVVTYQSDIVKQKQLLKLYSPIMDRFLSKASQVVATSQNYVDTSDVLGKYTPQIIPLGVSEERYPKADLSERIAKFVSHEKPYFLSVGVNRHYKGYDVLLAAAQDIDANFVIASAGPQAQDLADQVERLGLLNVSVLFDVTDAEKMAAIEHCTALLFPSNNRAEAYGISLVEAAMKSKPLVSCEIGTGTSFVNADGETGLVIQPHSADALKTAIAWMLDHPKERGAMGKAARKRYETLLTGDQMTKSYADLYKKIVA